MQVSSYKDYEQMEFKELAGAPVDAIQGLSQGDAEALQLAFNIGLLEMKDPGGPQGRRGNDAKTRDRSGISEEWLVPFLLLCLRDGDSYGYRLEESLGELDFFDGTRPGQMYRTLWHMEQDEMVLCDREDGGFRLPSGGTRSPRRARPS